LFLLFPLLVYGQTSQPTSNQSDPYDELESQLATLSDTAQKAQVALDWLGAHPDHPRAFEVRAQISGYVQDLSNKDSSREESNEAFLSDLLSILDLGDPLARGEAARHLAERGDSRAILPLIYALRDPSNAVRAEVAKSLGAFVDPRAQA